MLRKIPAGKFKAECLKVMDEVQRTHIPLVVTKRNVPVVKVMPAQEREKKAYFGWMKGTIKTTGDIISPIDEAWDADR